MADWLPALVQTLIELFFGATGRQLLRLFGVQRNFDTAASLFTGMAFWIVVVILTYAITQH